MNFKFKKPFFCFPVILIILLLQTLCCSQKKNSQNTTVKNKHIKKSNIAEIASPRNGEVYTCGDSIKVDITIKNKDITIDSIKLYAGTALVSTFKENYKTSFWSSKNAKVGQNIFKTVFFFNDSLKESHSVSFTLLSDIIPKNYKYHVINSFPHDENAYTQGLVYDNGFLFESTGQRGHSSLRKVQITNGKSQKMVNLNKELFGEGITIFDNKIYQITYKSQIGFIYDKESLTVIRGFDYPISEGWGLTNDNELLYMTDGSSSIYILEPEYFSQIGQIDVLNNKSRISRLNELEYIEGKIFANVYGDTYIVIIDPVTGKVTGKIELKELMPKRFEGDMNKVLNGIAYNPETKHLYITGKLWPLLYEIEIENYF